MDVSSDLAEWDERILVTDASGRSSFRDLAATNRPHTFYRARVLP